MAKMSYEEAMAASAPRQATNSVSYFGLKNDGDEAIVRFMFDSVSEFDILTTHQTQINGKYRRVSCLRNMNDPLENCPFCASGNRVQQRIYIHLLEYVTDENGNVRPVAKLWERSLSYISVLKNYMAEYGNLSDYIFKIKRNGPAGSMDTTYNIIPANPTVYKADRYVKDTSLFEGVTALGTAVLEKSYDEMIALINPEAKAEPEQSYQTYQPTYSSQPSVTQTQAGHSYSQPQNPSHVYTQPQLTTYGPGPYNIPEVEVEPNTFAQQTQVQTQTADYQYPKAEPTFTRPKRMN